MAPKVCPNIIECESLLELERTLIIVQERLSLPESEETWDSIAHAIIHLAALSKGNAVRYGPEIVGALRSCVRPLLNAINSERSRLSGVAIELLGTVATALERSFDPLLSLFFPTLLSLCTRTNKVFVTRARTCITTIIEHTHSPTILSYLADAVKDKSASLRLAAADGVLACLNSFNPPDLEKEQRAREVEDIIRAIATDASADVRKAARRIFEAYKVLLPTRVESFTEPLTPTIKKYLDITPKVVPATKQPTSRPTSSQSLHSVPVAARSKPLHPPKKVAPARMQRSAPSSSQSTSLRNGPSRATCAPSSRPQASSSVHVDITQSDRPFGGPLRVSKTQSTLQSGVEKAPSTRAGPIRPVMVMGTKTAAGEDLADSKGRVVGGARRVLLVAPPVEPSGPKDESEKTRADGADHLTRVRTISVSRSEGALSQSRSTTGLSRPKMAEKRIAGKDMKPAWGRGASSKLGAVSKPDFHKKIIPPKDHIPEEPPVAVQEVDTIAAVIPLPPSPNEHSPPALIALPPSPPVSTIELPMQTTTTVASDKGTDNEQETTDSSDAVSQLQVGCRGPVTPPRRIGTSDNRFASLTTVEQTPISALVASIQQGFLFTEYSPISPAQSHLHGQPDQPASVLGLSIRGRT